MTNSSQEFFEILGKILLRCWIIGFLMMLFSLVVFMLTGEVIYSIHGKMFGLSSHELDLIMYCGLGLFKVFVLIFFLLPWVSIKLVLRSR
jgi:hypothetical protein